MNIASGILKLVISAIPLSQDKIIESGFTDLANSDYISIKLQILDNLPAQRISIYLYEHSLNISVEMSSDLDDSFKEYKDIYLKIEDPNFLNKIKECWKLIINSFIIYHTQKGISYNPQSIKIEENLKELV